jgi:hypothetical protein
MVELPYELLRRARRYEVRRYPAVLLAETLYDKRPEGYDRLGDDDVSSSSFYYYYYYYYYFFLSFFSHFFFFFFFFSPSS